MTRAIRIGIVGLGKIARDQHYPAILGNQDFEIAFTADKAVKIDAAPPSFDSLKEALDSNVEFDAVALCTSPQPRYELFELLLERECAILLEKPPASNLEAAAQMSELASARGICLMTAWHSQYSPSISIATDWLKNNSLKHGMIEWRENAKKWHPGQGWLWQEGGYGVFDPGMNALSILTKITKSNWKVGESTISIPQNVNTPISASFVLLDESARIDVDLEFHDQSDETWNISLISDRGKELRLSRGGEIVKIDGKIVSTPTSDEYAAIYRRFAQLVRNGGSEVELKPLEIIDSVFAKATVTTQKAIEI